MKKIIKSFLAALLSLLLVFISMSEIFTAYAGPPGVVDDPDILATVTYDSMVVGMRGNSDFYVGEEIPFYANITVSSTTRSLPGAYAKLYLPKKGFASIGANNFSDWGNRPANNYLNIDSSDNDYHIVTLKFNSLGGGTTQTIPFTGFLWERLLANNEVYTITFQVYDGNDVLLESTNNDFVAKTYPIGYTDENLNNTLTYRYPQGSSQLQSDNKLANDLSTSISFITMRTDWPAPGTYHGTVQKTIGSDRRKTRITVQLPANENFDTTDGSNRNWTYNPVNHTIVIEKNYPDVTNFSEGFNIRYHNQPTGLGGNAGKVEFPITWEYVNDDGSTDPTSLQKSKVVVYYRWYPRTMPTDVGLFIKKEIHNRTLLFGSREDSTKHDYRISAGWTWDPGDPETPPKLGENYSRLISIEDNPSSDLELISYKIYYSNYTGKVLDASGNEQTVPVLSDAQKAALSNNQLIGTKADGSTEIIATDIAITESITEHVLPNPVHYKKLELKFTNPIEIQAPNDSIIDIIYNFRLAENSYNTVKAQLEALPDSENSYVPTYNRATVNGDNGAGTVWRRTDSDYALWGKSYIYESEHTIQNENFGTKHLGQNISTADSIKFKYRLPDGGINLKNPKFFILADPDLAFKYLRMHHYYNTEFEPYKDNCRVVYDFKNTGKTAYIWDLPTINIPGGSIEKEFAFFPEFETTRNTHAGQGSIDTYFIWDNNEEAATDAIPGLYPDILDLDDDGNTNEKFSSKTATYFYTPPLELILSKKSKRDDAPVSHYSALTTADSEQVVDYKIDIFNNTTSAVGDFTIFDILPHVGDKVIAPDENNNYTDRGSTYNMTLTGPIDPHPDYTYEYSTTPVTQGDIAANYAGATWSSSVTDWSAVTMFRIKMRPGYILGQNFTDTVTFKAKMPDTTALERNDKAVNTFVGFSGDDYTGAFEALENIVKPKKYEISGKIYYDIAPVGGIGNGTYISDDGDVPAVGKRVMLLDSAGNPVLDENGNQVITTSDSNGDYIFNNISKVGTYKVAVVPEAGDTLSPNSVNSTSSIIGNDFLNANIGGNTVFESSIALTNTDDKKIANAALEAINSTLKIKYVDMSGNPIPLDDGSGNVADTDSIHTLREAYTVIPPLNLIGVADYEYAEADLINGMPLTGNLNPGQNTIILKYKRKDAGNIIVHHYEDGESTELYTPAGETSPVAEVYLGAGKHGLTESLTNKEAFIAGFEYVGIDVSNADSASTPTAFGDTTLTYNSASQTVIYRYRRMAVPVTIVPATPSTPVVPTTPATPSTPVTPNIPVVPSTPTVPSIPTSPSTPVTITPSPIRPVTPNPIIIPVGDDIAVIRPKATPSTATPSNINRGGGNSGGNKGPGSKNTERNVNINKPSENPVILIDTPKPIPEPKDIPIATSTSTRQVLSVPKTADEKDLRGYLIIILSSIAAATVLVLKKKEER